jgi:F0F1-type ATP synthase assembly protein I
MSDREERRRSGWEVSGVFVPAGLLIGTGIGWVFDHMVLGLIIGLGAGFLAMALTHLLSGK